MLAAAMADEDPELAALQQKLDSELKRPLPDHRPALRQLLYFVAALLGFMLLLGAGCSACSEWLSGAVHT